METTRVRLPRPRNLNTANNAHFDNNTRRIATIQRYAFPNITPPSMMQSQRRAYTQHFQQQQQHQQHQQQQAMHASQFIGDHTGLVTPVKPVYKLMCRHCTTTVCTRGMKAILLADTTIELYSTDTPSQCIHVLEKDYLTRSCHCRIRDVACLECGNVIGYHVVSPCSQCLDACNNGHFWMFHSSACQPAERHDKNKQIMLWNNLPRAEMDMEFIMGARVPYDQLCR
ncbi:Protein fam72a [Rhizopus stolonifer]|uniref:Protein fam72a n=1 Tax=Rhizopus stolonifer TaxID=4846 RepID=A0A367JKB1_RHIST|nr:Protein fam72a [Rhizopus stolonifer]